ncbi:hypothetical protein Lalb_Chr01g0012041 [Lupinus albus]|uniref:Uncharacterized protein n=1 Tax=Lupinus albus TaxID=3870 RepID=A0A6A4R362_LUPAL|nr:hypothetical protein Lalb_Chr01g0012041 [Lupinus albus]
MFEATMEKMGLNSKNRLTTFFVVIFIAFPIVFTVTMKLRNSSFTILEGKSENKVLEGEIGQKNITFELLNGKLNVTKNGSRRVQNVTHENSEMLQGKIESGTDPIEGRTTCGKIVASEEGT